MKVDGEFVIPDTHPALPGHFPDEPVVPGAVVLDRAMAVLGRRMGLRLTAIRRAKFARQLPVNVACRVTARRRDDGMVVMDCFAEGKLVVSAVLACDIEARVE